MPFLCWRACRTCQCESWPPRGYSSHALREYVWSLGARPAIPTRRNEEPVACPDFIYHSRNRVERLWGRLKEWRAVATRYEKTARASWASSASLPPSTGSSPNRA